MAGCIRKKKISFDCTLLVVLHLSIYSLTNKKRRSASKLNNLMKSYSFAGYFCQHFSHCHQLQGYFPTMWLLSLSLMWFMLQLSHDDQQALFARVYLWCGHHAYAVLIVMFLCQIYFKQNIKLQHIKFVRRCPNG